MSDHKYSGGGNPPEGIVDSDEAGHAEPETPTPTQESVKMWHPCTCDQHAVAQPSSQAGEPERCPDCDSLRREIERLTKRIADHDYPEQEPPRGCDNLGHSSSSQARAGTALPAPLEFLQQKQWGEGTTPEHLAWLEKVAELSHEVEDHCPCGARPESIHTHPHLPGCPVEKLVKMVGDFRKLSDQATNHCVGLQKELDELKAAQAGTAGTPTDQDLYALLRGICEDVIDWLGQLSYDHGSMTAKNVLDHPTTQKIRNQLHAMYQHPLDNKVLLRTDQLEALRESHLAKARSEGAEAMRERAAKAKCEICRGDENYYEAKPQRVLLEEGRYVSNYGEIAKGWAHIGGSVEFVPCEASEIWALSLEMPDTPSNLNSSSK